MAGRRASQSGCLGGVMELKGGRVQGRGLCVRVGGRGSRSCEGKTRERARRVRSGVPAPNLRLAS